MNPQLAAALAQAKQTNQAVPVNMGTYTLMAYPNGQVGPQGSSGTARWTPQSPSMPVPPRPPFGAVSSPPEQPPTTSTTTNPATYTNPDTLQSFSSVPSTGAIVASGPGYGTGTVIPQTSTSGPLGSTGPVDRHDPVAAQARVYRINHGISTPDDSAVTDRLNAESLAAANAGRTYLDRNLAAQYGQPQPAGVSGPRTDVVNALLMPPSSTGTAYAQAQPTTQSPYQSPASQQPIVLAPTTAQPTQAQQPPVWYSVGQRYASGPATTQLAGRYDWPAAMQANSLLAQGIY